MQTSEELSITFQVDNNGNADDTIEIRITNANELEQLGFTLQSGDFVVARDVQSGGVSEQLEFIIRARARPMQRFETSLQLKQQAHLMIQKTWSTLTSLLKHSKNPVG